jgi:hypothetical protein
MKLSRIAPARENLVVDVWPGLHVVGRRRPVEVDLAVLEQAALRHGMCTNPVGDGTGGKFPELLAGFPMLRIGDQHVGWQAMRESADFACGAAGRRLAGQRKRAVARFGDLAHQQVHVVDHVVDPGAARVLVETHGPERSHPGLRVGVGPGQFLESIPGYAGEFVCLVESVFGNESLELVKTDRAGARRVAPRLAILTWIAVVHGGLLEWMIGAQAIADVGHPLPEVHITGHEFLIDRLVLDDVVADVVEDRQVALRLEDQFVVGKFGRAMAEGREHVNLDVLAGQTTVGHPRPQNRVHLGHVRAPQYEGVGVLDVVVATHRFVDPEGAHEAGYRRSHAVPCIGIEVVAQQAGLHQFGRGIAFPDRPLAGTEHGDIARPAFPERGLALVGHDLEGLIPSNRRELTALVELAVLHAQHGRGETILAVLDFRQEVTLDAVQPLVHRGVGVTLRSHDTAVPGSHQHAAARAAVAADALVPAHAVIPRRRCRCRLCKPRHTHPGNAGGRGNRLALDKVTTGQSQFHLMLPHQDRVRTGGKPLTPRARPAAD